MEIHLIENFHPISLSERLVNKLTSKAANPGVHIMSMDAMFLFGVKFFMAYTIPVSIINMMMKK
jgi:hypothetical protein